MIRENVFLIKNLINEFLLLVNKNPRPEIAFMILIFYFLKVGC